MTAEVQPQPGKIPDVDVRKEVIRHLSGKLNQPADVFDNIATPELIARLRDIVTSAKGKVDVAPESKPNPPGEAASGPARAAPGGAEPPGEPSESPPGRSRVEGQPIRDIINRVTARPKAATEAHTGPGPNPAPTWGAGDSEPPEGAPTAAPAGKTKAAPSFAPMVPARLILDPHLNATAKNVYCWLLMHAHGNPVCHAGQQQIATALVTSLDTVQRAIKSLAGSGYLQILPDMRMNANSYRLLERVPLRGEPKE